MIILSQEQERTLEKAGFISSDTSVVYLGTVAVRGDMKDQTVRTSKGEQFTCQNDVEFVTVLLTKANGN